MDRSHGFGSIAWYFFFALFRLGFPSASYLTQYLTSHHTWVSPLSKPLHSTQVAGPGIPCPCPPGSWSESPKSRDSSTLLLNQGRLSLEAGFEIIYAHVWPVCRQPLFAACGWKFIALGFISGSNKNLPENYHDSWQDNNEINLWNCKSAPATFFAL